MSECLALVSVAIHIMARDNGFIVKCADEWPKYIDYDYLEGELVQLTSYELDVVLTGDTVDAEQIIESHGIQQLDHFLKLLFDGDLNECFFDAPVMVGGAAA